MKYFCLLLSILVISCSTKQKRPAQNILTASNLQLQLYEIDPSVENTIRTKNGASVRFPKDAFKLNGAGKVQVSIKEAYSMKDILLAGLVTESNGKTLSSGGMIYLDARQNGKNIELQKKAGVSLPVSNYNDQMQVYKGEYTKDSSINWVEPKPLDSMPTREYDGKAMFFSNCSACHGITKAVTGPALYNALKRAPSKQWLYSYVRNWESSFSFKDSTKNNYALYSCCVTNYSATQMNKFPMLNDEALDVLFGYIQSVSDQNPPPPSNQVIQCAPCLNRKTAPGSAPADWDSLTIKSYPQFYIGETDSSGTIQPDDTLSFVPPAIQNDIDKNEYQPYYGFSISTFGWYNIDAISENMPGAAECTLTVKITNDNEQNNTTMFLQIPALKLLAQAYPAQDGKWVFKDASGSVHLIPGKQAYIIAFGERNKKLIYGIKPFIISERNVLELKVTGISKEAFVTQIGKLGLDELKLFAPEEAVSPDPPPATADGSAPTPATNNGTPPATPMNNPAASNRPGTADTVKYYYPADSLGKDCPCRNLK